MKTPISDFIREYADSDKIRLHMPGHKGKGDIEKYDITEIAGADSLYSADGIIRDSERIASEIFGADTFYSTEGSSLAIRAMLYLAITSRPSDGEPCVLAARNAHKVFVSAAALLGFNIEWICGTDNYLSVNLTASELDRKLTEMKKLPIAVYITTPDYLGCMLDVFSLAEVCHKWGVLLLVDNAHGAYLKLLSPSRHPIDLGADMCADSAHKTLPVLTGGAYLHVRRGACQDFAARAKDALALFGSTSPSYLILESLDRANPYLAGNFAAEMSSFIDKIAELKRELADYGYELVGDEPMKITVAPSPVGYTGTDIAALLSEGGIEVEFSDPDHVVLMPTPRGGDESLEAARRILLSVAHRAPRTVRAPVLSLPERVMSPRVAMLSQTEIIPVSQSSGRVLGAVTVGCPPAVPILISGERISEKSISAFNYYGIDTVSVIK